MLLFVGIGLGILVGPFVENGKSLPAGRMAYQVHPFSFQATAHAKSTPVKSHKKLPRTFVADYSLPPVENGMAPVVSRLHTSQPVVFLTIDDGAHKDPSDAAMMKKNRIKASLFLAKSFIDTDPDFFKQFVTSGSLIEDHTLTHDLRMTKRQTYEQQKEEICGMAEYEEEHYGRRPTLFRPPGGAHTPAMQRAAHACGMRAVVTWMATVNGGAVQYQVGDTLRPGDIVLMHFRPTFKEDLQAFIDAANAAGLHTELLEDALPAQ